MPRPILLATAVSILVIAPALAATSPRNDPTLEVVATDAATGETYTYTLAHAPSAKATRFLLTGSLDVADAKGNVVRSAPVFLPLATDQLAEDTVTLFTDVARIDFCDDVVELFDYATSGTESIAASEQLDMQLEVTVRGDWPSSLETAVGMPLEVFFAGVFTELDARDIVIDDDAPDDHPFLPDADACSGANPSIGPCVQCCDQQTQGEYARCATLPPAQQQACIDAADDWNRACRLACAAAMPWPDPDNCGQAHCDDNECAWCCANNANDMRLWCEIVYAGPDQTQERNDCLDSVDDWLEWCIEGCANHP